MTPNELKKGTVVRLRNGLKATLMDNKIGPIRMADVEGYTHEMGSVYAHDISCALVDGVWYKLEYTKSMLKCRKTVDHIFH